MMYLLANNSLLMDPYATQPAFYYNYNHNYNYPPNTYHYPPPPGYMPPPSPSSSHLNATPSSPLPRFNNQPPPHPLFFSSQFNNVPPPYPFPLHNVDNVQKYILNPTRDVVAEALVWQTSPLYIPLSFSLLSFISFLFFFISFFFLLIVFLANKKRWWSKYYFHKTKGKTQKTQKTNKENPRTLNNHFK